MKADSASYHAGDGYNALKYLTLMVYHDVALWGKSWNLERILSKNDITERIMICFGITIVELRGGDKKAL